MYIANDLHKNEKIKFLRKFYKYVIYNHHMQVTTIQYIYPTRFWKDTKLYLTLFF
jgi:hypothetical protein